MEPVTDFSWMKDLLLGQVVERFPLGDYRAVAVQVESSDERRHSQYHYRLLIFPQKLNKPVLALNLETSLLGASCLTEQTGSGHQILADAEEEMAYEEFRRWALERARADLHLA
jgi:hypothetical protein